MASSHWESPWGWEHTSRMSGKPGARSPKRQWEMGSSTAAAMVNPPAMIRSYTSPTEPVEEFSTGSTP